jgi:hypothetical protein
VVLEYPFDVVLSGTPVGGSSSKNGCAILFDEIAPPT